jgi:hypothetical protein
MAKSLPRTPQTRGPMSRLEHRGRVLPPSFLPALFLNWGHWHEPIKRLVEFVGGACFAMAVLAACVYGLASYLCRRYGWPIGVQKVALENEFGYVWRSRRYLDVRKWIHFIMFWVLARLEKHLPFYNLRRIAARIERRKRHLYSAARKESRKSARLYAYPLSLAGESDLRSGEQSGLGSVPSRSDNSEASQHDSNDAQADRGGLV